MSDIGVGILGYGAIGRVHARAIAAVPGLRVAAVTVRRADADVPGARVHRSLAGMLGDRGVDVVAVCTPSGDHPAHALAALGAGRHVVVEKPFTLDVAAGQRAVEEARRRGLLLSVISPRRLSPPGRHVFDAVRRPESGRPILGEVLVRWHRDQAYYDAVPWRGSDTLDGGVLLNQAIHYIDLLRWCMGPVAEVSGVGATLTHRTEAEDSAAAVLRFRSGALGAITATTSAPVGLPAETTVLCEHAGFCLDDAGIRRWDAPFPMPELEPETGSGASNAGAISGIGHVRQWTDVAAALRDGRDAAVTGEDGLASAALALAVRRSRREGRPVEPEYVGD